MKITFEQNKTLRFEDLKKGDVFKFHPDDDRIADLDDFERDSVYMVIYTGMNVAPFDAINLSNGELFAPDITLRVIKLDAELIIRCR